ncbi:FecCD family ABC transporter permease [Herpetosiphon sp. NSE202]|uniref:FecCD family ABC transporter permease n=1 Tax=Herpetosiphon sp. NSE202 TaxID=3351349 RepID=UPI003631BE01
MAVTLAQPTSQPKPKRRAAAALAIGLLLVTGLLLVIMTLSINFGATNVAPSTVWAALFNYDSTSTQHLIIRTLRMPRVLVAAIVGAILALAGAIMQGLTRNPLADAGLLGIESGAALGVVLAITFFDIKTLNLYSIFAFAGAAVTAVLVYSLGSLGRGGPTPLKLTLAGAMITAFCSSFTSAILILNQQTLDEVRLWLAGTVAGRDLGLIAESLPYVVVGTVLALSLGRSLTAMALGEDVARGLGQRTGWVKVIAAIAVVLLAGSAVALAGPIGFLGLLVPHIMRFIVGIDYRWLLPYCAIGGALLLVLADIIGRVVVRPMEIPVGVVTALLGGPMFIYLVRWRVQR